MTTQSQAAGGEDDYNQLLNEAEQYAVEAKTLWEELEEGEDHDEEEDHTWYRKFGGKINSRTGLMEQVKGKVLEKVARIKIHFQNPEEIVKIKQETKTTTTNKVLGLTKIVRRVQNLVSGHGVALEYLREVVVKQSEQISKLETKLHETTRTPAWDEQTLNEVLEKKTSNIKKEMESMKVELEEVKTANEELNKEKIKLVREVDETRQRGMKGNLLVTSYPNASGPSKLVQLSKTHADGRVTVESSTEMLLRLIQSKTSVEIKQEDVVACHRMPENKNAWILRIGNMAPGSGWEQLAAGMLSGHKPNSKEYFENDGVFLNFQITQVKAKVLQQVKLARKLHKDKLYKFSVNQNGRITILKTKTQWEVGAQSKREKWEEVKDLDHLKELVDLPFPLKDPAVAAKVARSQSRQPRM